MSSYYDSDLVGYYRDNGTFKPWMNSDYRYSYRTPYQISDDLRNGKRIYIYRDYPVTSSYYQTTYSPSYTYVSPLRRYQSYGSLSDYRTSSPYLYSYSRPVSQLQKVDIYDDTRFSRYYY
ncbi:unnamed protein product [Schistosoma turkestanicum]|nr:unnamed protein product [Schistosoma turkestanicum]